MLRWSPSAIGNPTNTLWSRAGYINGESASDSHPPIPQQELRVNCQLQRFTFPCVLLVKGSGRPLEITTVPAHHGEKGEELTDGRRRPGDIAGTYPPYRDAILAPIVARFRCGPQTRIRSAKPAQVDVGKDVLHRRSLRSIVRLDKLAGALFDRSIHEFATHRLSSATGNSSWRRA